jgi:hypothetical protein
MPGGPIRRARRGGIRLADGTVIAFPKLTHLSAGLSQAQRRALSPMEKIEQQLGLNLESDGRDHVPALGGMRCRVDGDQGAGVVSAPR